MKMIPITQNLGATLALPLKMNLILSQGRRSRLVRRANQTKNYLVLVLKLWRQHGSAFTIKWLKACSVALQRKIGDNPMRSLRAIDKDLPLPRLTNGVPRFINPLDRGLIRNGHLGTIRFYLGLLNLYRVLEAPGVLKLSTITEPFKGDTQYLEDLKLMISSKKLIFFDLLPGFEKIRGMSLSPRHFIMSRSASPSNKMAAHGIFTDVLLMNKYRPDLWQDILDYLYITKPKVTKFVRQLQFAYATAMSLEKGIVVQSNGKVAFRAGLNYKPSAEEGHYEGSALSQFAIKVEPAGKLRLFALVDTVTQSTMAPLHDACFALLKLIPNDGTFNQELSIKRSQTKAVNANKAFSFDLTAATDRLPAVLISLLFEEIWKLPGLGSLWLSIMTNRDFAFTDKAAETYKVSRGPYRYAVGQPMGALSSWAGLALIHHWLVQLAAAKVHIRNYGDLSAFVWCEAYEILGDDLVIFDSDIADEYLLIMTGIGCEININKSIISRNRPVFEFAKRLCWGTDIVSGISLAQVRAGWNVGSRVANVLTFHNLGLISNPVLLATVLSRYASPKLNLKDLGVGVLALLGTLVSKGNVSHRVLAHALVDPSNEEADFEAVTVGLPLRACLSTAHASLDNPVDGYPFSHEDIRDEVYREYRSEFSTVILQQALKKATRLYENSDSLVSDAAVSMAGVTITDKTVELPKSVKLMMIQVEAFFTECIDQDDAKVTPEYLHDKVYDTLYTHSKYENCSVDQAISLLEEVEALEFKYTLREPQAPGKTIIESSPFVSLLRNMVNFEKVKGVHDSLNFVSSHFLPGEKPRDERL